MRASESNSVITPSLNRLITICREEERKEKKMEYSERQTRRRRRRRRRKKISNGIADGNTNSIQQSRLLR